MNNGWLLCDGVDLSCLLELLLLWICFGFCVIVRRFVLLMIVFVVVVD